ncbi:iron complex transport system permease protein [Maritalea mobilis]|uniref:Iron complex transport system permease protein n=1 Tax=Maritalea mobilis TaxID=483324 RepID=A0A4R6VWC7_9HYPH|nr:iron ABC transporter permease [Maritalea mobilis]TDQ67136.1 iron complex transport system permease protein [Maritalea mobilis]
MFAARYPLLTIGASIALIVMLIAGVFWGTAPIPWQEKLAVLLRAPDAKSSLTAIIWEWRMPRVLACGLVGAALALSGTLIQTALRNPLADPYLLGLSSGASAAAVAAIIWLPAGIVAAFGLPLIAFFGAALAFGITLLMAYNRERPMDRLLVILAGVAVSLLFQSFTAFLLHISDPNATKTALNWLMGSAAGTNWQELPIMAIATIIVTLLALSQHKQLDALLMGDARATSLGVATAPLKLAIFLATALLTGLSVSIMGIVGFVGLIVPHLARQLCGSAHKKLIPLAMLLGASILVFTDLLCRTLLAPSELPLAVLLALFATPPFILILRQTRHVA